jgi:hypothetical protein
LTVGNKTPQRRLRGRWWNWECVWHSPLMSSWWDSRMDSVSSKRTEIKSNR